MILSTTDTPDYLLVLKHWTRGGTGLTNFPPEDLPLYIKAITHFGDPNMVIVFAPNDPETSRSTDYSLHCVSHGPTPNCSAFWDCYKKMHDAVAI